MRRWRDAKILGGALALAGIPIQAQAKCEVNRVAELPITMQSLRPLIDAKINGRDARFIIDSGAFYSLLWPAVATQYALKTYPAPMGFHLTGVGGEASVQLTTVKEFTLLNVPFKNMEFLVSGTDAGFDGLLGQNFLEKFDVEYDLAHGVIRLFKTDGCSKAQLAYWVQAGQSFSVMTTQPTDPLHPFTTTTAQLNGQPLHVMFDSGAFTSLLSTHAAARAGIRPDSPGVADGGVSNGIGRKPLHSYVAVFDSFKVGDNEEIHRAKLRFADLSGIEADMLLGADFFISHRIMVANREHRLFLTYNGGPVFDLTRRSESPGAAQSALDASPSALPAGDAALTDPAELARRGSALVARRDFAAGLAELSRAVELAPTDPEYVYQRANAYLASGDRDRALADLNRVIELRHDFLPAYLPRAQLKMAAKDPSGALADLDEVDALSARQADLRLLLGSLYQALNHLPAAIEQYGEWIKSHPDDARLPGARARRCLSSALANQDLVTALEDCDYALRHLDKSDAAYGQNYAHRGLLRLRRAEFTKALADFDEALKSEPNNAAALFGRSVAQSHLQHAADAERDLAQARKLNPGIVTSLEQRGF